MVICQYFLQGRCSFGANCRNEHVYGNDGRGGKNSGNNQSTNIIWQIHNEVVEAEKGGLWPLTSFGLKKEGPSLPGWNDVSPEEVRWTLYEAQKNGTVNQALNHINQLYKNAEQARNALKQPSQQMISILNDVLKGKTPSQSSASIFSSPNKGKSGFRFDVAANMVFGASPATSNMASPSIFGGGQPATPNPGGGSIFGGSQTPSPAANAGSIFGGNQTPGINPTPTPGTIFGGTTGGGGGGGFYNQSIFSNQMTSTPAKSTASNIFTQPQQPFASNIFSPGGGESQVQTPPPTQNIFSPPAQPQPQPNIFAQPQQSPNIFGNNPSFPSYPTFNVFGDGGKPATDNPFQPQGADPGAQAFAATKSAATPAVIPNAKEDDSSAYSKMEDLNEDEMKSFTSTMFAFGNIPLKPPPQQYC